VLKFLLGTSLKPPLVLGFYDSRSNAFAFAAFTDVGTAG